MADSGSSAATTADADTHHGDELMTEAPKSEGIQADTPSSLGSSPEPAPAADSSAGAPDQQQPPKRKGGRKPIYATSEERKQRNRQAQAAFRERRTEYIKQLEATIKQHEEALRSLQQSHRSAADECLMLRYKNSLLERILLEKGIDVQAELQVKTGSPVFDPSHLPPQMPAPMIPTPLQRTAVNRQQARRSYQARPQPATQYMPRTASMSMHSPTGQPTPSSHASSPTAMSSRSTASIQQGGMPSPASAVMTQGQIQSPPGHPQSAGARQAHRPMSSSHYPSSSEQEYDAPHHQDVDIIHEPHPRQQLQQDFEGDDFELPEQFQDFQPHPVQQQLPPTQPPPQGHGRTRPAPTQTSSYPPGHSNLDSFDPMLDSDPFGLTASMHFPTNYSFDQPPEK